MTTTSTATGSSRSKAKGKRVAKSEREPTNAKATKKAREGKKVGNDLFNKFNSMKFDQTKFVDSRILEELGISDDVMLILRHMGLEKFMSMREVAQQGVTCEFLATLNACFFDRQAEEDQADYEKYGRGYIRFNTMGRPFTVTFSELCEIFGFEEDETRDDTSFGFQVGEIDRIWEAIAPGRFVPGASKSASIRNPAVRYAHKALAHVFYAKVEFDTISTEELEFLGMGLGSIFPTLRDGGRPYWRIQKPCLALILAKSLMEYKDWAWKTKAKKAFIGIGWMVTAILKAKAQQVLFNPAELPLMDTLYLLKTKFMRRHNKTEFAYSFYPTSHSKARILLPNPELTRIDALENLAFQPSRAFYIDGLENDDHERPLGPERYDFTPYEGSMSSNIASSSAHARINLLQRMVKWQQRNMGKMAKTIRKMKKQIRELGCKGGDGDASMTQMETSGGESSHRASRKSKGKRRAPTPSPTSSNESLDLGTESSGSASPSQSE